MNVHANARTHAGTQWSAPKGGSAGSSQTTANEVAPAAHERPRPSTVVADGPASSIDQQGRRTVVKADRTQPSSDSKAWQSAQPRPSPNTTAVPWESTALNCKAKPWVPSEDVSAVTADVTHNDSEVGSAQRRPSCPSPTDQTQHHQIDLQSLTQAESVSAALLTALCRL